MEMIHEIELNLNIDKNVAPKKIVVTANDNVEIHIQLMKGKDIFPLSEDYTYRLVSKPRGKSITIKDLNLVNGKVVAPLNHSETGYQLPIECAVQVFDVEGNRVSSVKFDVVVLQDYTTEGEVSPSGSATFTVVNEEEFNRVSSIANEVEDAKGVESTLGDKITSIEVQSEKNWMSAKGYREIQSNLYSLFFRNLRLGNPVTLCAMGDSMTYGQDNNSTDIREAVSIQLPDGSWHSNKRAGKTYPEKLQECLDEVYGSGKVTVINRGYSGDWTKRAYERWITPSGANLTILCYGTNDSRATWSEFPGEIEPFLYWYRKIIERELERDSAIILMTPPKTREQEQDINPKTFENAIKELGKEYGIPVVDGSIMTKGHSANIYSDGTHFNTKGYSVWGAKITSLFVGLGVDNMEKVGLSQKFGVRKVIENLYSKKESTFFTSSPLPDETRTSNGQIFYLFNGESVYYSFYGEVGDMIVLPTLYFDIKTSTYVNAKMTLDFGVEQANYEDLTMGGRNNVWGRVVPSSTAIISKSNTKGSPNGFYTPDNFQIGENHLYITQSGYHTIKIECQSDGDGTIRFYGLSLEHKKIISSRVKCLNFTTHDKYNGTGDVLTSRIKLMDLHWALGVNYGSEHFSHVPLKITVVSFDQQINTYTMQVGQLSSSTNGWILSNNVTTHNLKEIPDATKVRTIGSLTFDTTNYEIIINWSGAINQPSNVIVTIA